jgi:alkylhydroperoxidase family enzyme
MPATSDPYAPLREKVLQRVLEGTGESDPSLRQAVAERTGVPADLRALVEKIHDHAYKVTDEDIARLQPTYSDDQLFEIIVSASLGASRRRLMAGLKALGDA